MRSSLVAVFTAAVVAAAGCSKDPAAPPIPQLEAVVADGDGQYGPVGGSPTRPLRALVRVAASGSPFEDQAVLWSIVSGDASFVTSEATVTDSAGIADARLRFGSQPGPVVVRLTVVNQETVTVDFTAHAVERPALEGLSTGLGGVGSEVVLTGSNFSPEPTQNVVLFSGIRATVTAATQNDLTVTVPACLPARRYQISVQLGPLRSGSLPFEVTDGGPARTLAPGEVVDLTSAAAFDCFRFSGEGDARYLALVHSTSTVGVARHDYTLTGLSETGSTYTSSTRGPAALATPDAHTVWHDSVRALEARRNRSAPILEVGPTRAPGRASIPTIGERRSFKVLNKDKEFDDVDAVARFVGARVALYVDESSPGGGFAFEDLEDFAERFDDVIHPVVSGTFGQASDLDADQRIAVLFTPTVNRLTPRNSNGFVGGFFYGVDLVPELAGSNGAEVFYTLVPDPQGSLSDARTADELLSIVPAILAHEYQHMIHFNERRLERGQNFSEATWLSEALAQTAEEVVARSYAAQGDHESADLFRLGNRGRARRYLADPSAVSVLFGVGQGTLEERGAGLLHSIYLGARFGETIWRDLTQTTRTGVGNVEARAGVSWESLLSDWWAAVWLDGRGGEGVLEYLGLDLATFLAGPHFPLVPSTIADGDFDRSGSLWSGSADYYILVPSADGSVTLRLGGSEGAEVPLEAGLQVRLVRLP